MRDRKTKKTPSRLAHWAGSKRVLFYLKRPVSKFDLSSGQVKVRSTVKVRSWPNKVNTHIFRNSLTSQVVWHHLCVSISIMSQVIGENQILTSFDIRWPPRDPNHQLHLEHHRWGEWPWSWKSWVVSGETGSISIFPHKLINGRSRNWPELWSPG